MNIVAYFFPIFFQLLFLKLELYFICVSGCVGLCSVFSPAFYYDNLQIFNKVEKILQPTHQDSAITMWRSFLFTCLCICPSLSPSISPSWPLMPFVVNCLHQQVSPWVFQQARPQPASRVVYTAILCIYTLHTNLDMYWVFKPPLFSIYCCKHCASNQVKSTHEPRKFQDFVTWSLPTLEDGLFLALRKVGGFLTQVSALFIHMELTAREWRAGCFYVRTVFGFWLLSPYCRYKRGGGFSCS